MSKVITRNDDGTVTVDNPIDEARGRLKVLREILPEELQGGIVEKIRFVTADGRWHMHLERHRLGVGTEAPVFVDKTYVESAHQVVEVGEPDEMIDDDRSSIIRETASLREEVAILRRERAERERYEVAVTELGKYAERLTAFAGEVAQQAHMAAVVANELHVLSSFPVSGR